jgi:hypothetical protein
MPSWCGRIVTAAKDETADHRINQESRRLKAAGLTNVATLDVFISFTDARGKRWYRDHDGRLTGARDRIDTMRRVLRIARSRTVPLGPSLWPD